MPRLQSSYENLSLKYILKSHDYQKQYSHLYAYRLAEMTKLLKPLAQKKWGSSVPIKKLCDLREEQDDDSLIIIGTIFKHQVHKPSILREISEENQLAPQPQRENFCDDEDKLVLEDEIQRVRLQGKIDSNVVGTGAVCAVYGMIEEDGRFDVEDVLYYEGGPQRPLPYLDCSRKVVLISGIDVKNAMNHIEAINLFQHWICGNLPGLSSDNVVRVILAGNSVSSVTEQRAPVGQTRVIETNDTASLLVLLDNWLSSLSETANVDIMPGDCDPANFMLPQQPFHPCMFPEAARNKTFRSVTNPYNLRVDGVDILGCSGQNVHDLLRSTHLNDQLEALRSTLIWSHIAPTAPDTLSCYPHVDSDPFIIRECPHIYFAGNCEKFETAIHEGSDGQKTRLVCVPKFAKSLSVAVVDLSTLDCRELSFAQDQ